MECGDEGAGAKRFVSYCPGAPPESRPAQTDQRPLPLGHLYKYLTEIDTDRSTPLAALQPTDPEALRA